MIYKSGGIAAAMTLALISFTTPNALAQDDSGSLK
jgi:hypothetical protein